MARGFAAPWIQKSLKRKGKRIMSLHRNKFWWNSCGSRFLIPIKENYYKYKFTKKDIENPA